MFIVVIVVAILTLAGFAFVSLMSVEHEASNLRGREIQTQALADSGEAIVRTVLETPPARREVMTGAVGMQAIQVDPMGGPNGCVAIVRPELDDGRVVGIGGGMVNESSKLNLAVLTQWDRQSPGSARKALLALPGMSQTAADSILDWIDGDETARRFGAEADYYKRQGVPYKPRNGPPTSLEELLLVRDVTREQVFGPDADLNYMPDGHSSAAPWLHLLTIYSAERNVDPNGAPRIDLNDADLKALHARLLKAFGREWADFIILYRQYGPAKQPKAQALDEPARNRRNRDTAAESSEITIDFTLPAKRKVQSPLDLVDATVRFTVDAKEDESAAPRVRRRDARERGNNAEAPENAPPPKAVVARTIASPIAAQRSKRATDLARLLDFATATTQPVIVGRINVNEAPLAVLSGVPGMPAGVLRPILTRRRQSANSDGAAARRHPTWLWTEGVVDLPTMKTLLPYLTCGGDVHRAQIIGFFNEENTAFTRIEVVVDASTLPAHRVYYKDLTLLGRGFPLQTLLALEPAKSSDASSAPFTERSILDGPLSPPQLESPSPDGFFDPISSGMPDFEPNLPPDPPTDLPTDLPPAPAMPDSTPAPPSGPPAPAATSSN